MKISRTILIRINLSIISFFIGVVIYWLFNNSLLSKSNLIYTIIRNYLSDGLWAISFFFVAINFSKNITKNYILLTAVFVVGIGIIFEIMQLLKIVNGTFDLIDVLVYFISVLIACLFEKIIWRMENEKA